LDSPGAPIWLAARLATDASGELWSLPEQINIGSDKDEANGKYELSLVLATKDLTADYEGRFARAENNPDDEDAKNLGDAFPPGIRTVSITVNRISAECH
jgi:hypothetical protein